MSLPIDFKANLYKKNNKDLEDLCEEEATLHFLLNGHKEKREYKKTKKEIIIFSPQWPYYDRNSGGKRLFEILKIIKEEADTFYFLDEKENEENKKYKNELKKLGIRVDSTENLHNKLLELKNNKVSPEFCFFCWWTTCSNYYNVIKSIFPKIKIVSDSVDVHWLREERGGNYNKERKNAEAGVYKSSDIVLAVTHEDRVEIEKECNIENVLVLSNIHEEKEKTHCKGKDIVFVGGFNHPPNVSAALRSFEIYNRFKKESNNSCCLYIVGDKPPEEVKKLHDGKNVFVTGYVEDIGPYLLKAKALLAPLSYGAGVKGKICEAVMHKVPVVTTKIGAEGLDFKNFEECFIAESDGEFVACLKHLYCLNEEIIEEISEKAFKKISNFISKKSAGSTIKKIVNADKHVVVSIATYKNEEILEECLKSIKENTEYKNLDIIVSDNASQKRVESLIQKFRYKKLNIHYTKNEKNEFFSKPHNKVINQFKISDVILLNDDTIIKTKCWVKVLQNSAYLAGDIACCGGKSILPDGTLDEAGSVLFSDGRGVNIGKGDDPQKEVYNKRKFVGYCSASLLYIKRDAINEIGLLDEDFKPLYYEDSDWQYRAHEKGFKVLYEPNCVYIHRSRSTTRNKLNEYMENCRKVFLEKHKNYDIESYNEISKWNLNPR